MSKCPYCDYETPEPEGGIEMAQAWQEVAHMELSHPDIIRERLRKWGLLDMTIRFTQEGEDMAEICDNCGKPSTNLSAAGAGLYCEHCGEPSEKGKAQGFTRPPTLQAVPEHDQGEQHLAFIAIQRTEHEAWGAVVSELRKRNVADINTGGKDESLHDAIVAWAEELAHLRMNDPDPMHAVNALRERREKYLGGDDADSA